MRTLMRDRGTHRLRKVLVGVLVVAMLQGVFPVLTSPKANAAIAVRGSVTAFDSSTSTPNLAFASLPSGWQQGDVFVAIFSIYDSGATISSISGTSGWTPVPTNNTVVATNISSFMYYKVATASESAPTVTFSASAKTSGVIVAYSGVDTTSPFSGTATPKTTTSASTTMTTNAIASSMPTGGVVVAAFAGYNTSSNTTATYSAVNGSSPTITMTLEGGSSGGTQLKNKPAPITGIEDGTLSSASTLPSQSMTSSQTMISAGFLQVLKPYTAPTLTQSVYRWYSNANSTAPGSALANESTAATVAAGTPVRLRMQLDVATAALSATSQAFQLEYATSTSGPWTTGFSWYDNSTPTDGTTLSSSLLTGTDVVQTYEENNPTVSNPNAVSAGQQTEWDFSIDTTGMSAGTTYYFRMAKSGGTAISAYTVYPAIAITAAGPTLEQQMRGGGSVVNGVKGSLTW